MDKWNNYDTLEHHDGMIWISKLLKKKHRGNVCVLQNGTFRVMAYISPNMLENKDLSTVVAEILETNGTSYMLKGC